jgi:hypothetical protein
VVARPNVGSITSYAATHPSFTPALVLPEPNLPAPAPGTAPAGSAGTAAPAGDSAPAAPAGNTDLPHPWGGGTGFPAPTALPPAPGSGSGGGPTAGSAAGTAAWLPDAFLVVPPQGFEPISGPLQHAYRAVTADPGSSPD